MQVRSRLRPRIRAPTLALLLVASALLAFPAAHAAPAPVPSVEAVFTLSHPSLDRLDLVGVLHVSAYAVDGRIASAAEIARASDRPGSSSLEALELAAREEHAGTLARAFPGARVHMTAAEVDRESVAAARSGHGPLRVSLGAAIERPRADAGLGSLTDEAVLAALGAGARWTTELQLGAPVGHLVAYHVRPPALTEGTAVLAASPGAVDPDGASASFILDNRAGAAALAAQATIVIGDATAAPPEREEIVQRVELRLGALDAANGSMPVDAQVSLEIRSLALAGAFPELLPPGVSLDLVDADGVRALHRAGLVGPTELAQAEAAILARLHPALAASLPGATFTGAIVRDDLASTSPGAPIRFLAQAQGAHALPPAQAENAQLALALGAVLNVDLALAASAQETTLVVHAPPEMRIGSGEEGRPEGLSVTILRGDGAPAGPAELRLRSADAATYDAPRATVDVVVDMQRVEAPLSDIATPDLQGQVVTEVRLHVVEVPFALREAMGEDVELHHVSSDGLRLLVERGLVNEDRLRSLLAEAASGRVAPALGAEVLGESIELQPLGAPSMPLTDEKPLVIVIRTDFAKPLLGAAPQTQASIALYSQQTAFDLERLGGADTSYTVILPRGLDLTSLEVAGGERTAWHAPDGRAGFAVRPGAEGAHVVASLAVSPLFLVAHFAPVLGAAGAGLAAVVAAPFAWRVWRRRR